MRGGLPLALGIAPRRAFHFKSGPLAQHPPWGCTKEVERFESSKFSSASTTVAVFLGTGRCADVIIFFLPSILNDTPPANMLTIAGGSKDIGTGSTTQTQSSQQQFKSAIVREMPRGKTTPTSKDISNYCANQIYDQNTSECYQCYNSWQNFSSPMCAYPAFLYSYCKKNSTSSSPLSWCTDIYSHTTDEVVANYLNDKCSQIIDASVQPKDYKNCVNAFTAVISDPTSYNKLETCLQTAGANGTYATDGYSTCFKDANPA